MSTEKPCVLYANAAVSKRFDALNEEVAYRERAANEIAAPLVRALTVAREARLQAAKELGIDVDMIDRVFFVRGKGVFWEDEDWRFDAEAYDLVPRRAEGEPAKKSSRKRT